MSILKFAIDAKKYGYLKDNLNCQKQVTNLRIKLGNIFLELNDLGLDIAHLEEDQQSEPLNDDRFGDLRDNGRANLAEYKTKEAIKLLEEEQKELQKNYELVAKKRKSSETLNDLFNGGVK